MPEPIRLAVVGVGNCASSLVQGLAHYRRAALTGPRTETSGAGGDLGLMHPRIGPYGAADIEVVAAFDVDHRKVGHPLGQAIFAAPNNTLVFETDVPPGPVVSMGEVLDGVSDHMTEAPPEQGFRVARQPSADIEAVLRASQAQVLVNYLPVGSRLATQRYAQACLNAGVALVNCMPVFIVSDADWAARFARAGLPCVGDDIKAQVGATIVHRVLARLFGERGVRMDRTYQLNVGGNSDFLNMLNQGRLADKRRSKTEAVRSQLTHNPQDADIHIGPSDFVPWMRDNKVCFLRMEGRGFGGVPLNLELRLSVEDSPNSAGVAIDAIRCCALARQRGISGPLNSVAAYTMKHPPTQMTDAEARTALDDFIAGAATH